MLLSVAKTSRTSAAILSPDASNRAHISAIISSSVVSVLRRLTIKPAVLLFRIIPEKASAPIGTKYSVSSIFWIKIFFFNFIIILETFQQTGFICSGTSLETTNLFILYSNCIIIFSLQ